MNPWVKFLIDNKGKGYTNEQLRKLYQAEQSTEEVYNFDRDASIKHESLLEDLKTQVDIPALTKKLQEHDILNEDEQDLWYLAFDLAVTKDYSLTKEQLLGSHDWWLERILYESGIDDDIYDDIVTELKTEHHKDIHEFMDHVRDSFSIYELVSIDHPELKLN